MPKIIDLGLIKLLVDCFDLIRYHSLVYFQFVVRERIVYHTLLVEFKV